MVAIREFQRKHTGSNIRILCGDFNTEPCEAAYELIVSRNIVDENKKKIQAENHIKVWKVFPFPNNDNKIMLFLKKFQNVKTLLRLSDHIGYLLVHVLLSP